MTDPKSESETKEVPTPRWFYLPWNPVLSTNGRVTVTIGNPKDDHDCDQMGCSSVEHVISSRHATEEERKLFETLFKKSSTPPSSLGQESAEGNLRKAFEALSHSCYVHILRDQMIDPKILKELVDEALAASARKWPK